MPRFPPKEFPTPSFYVAARCPASFNALGFDAVAVKRVYDVLAGLMHLLVTPFVPAGRRFVV